MEEGFLAFLLAAMTLLTFIQVVLRYVFSAGMIWALEMTTFLFAWLVIMGIGYGIRVHSHIGVDAFVKLFPTPIQRLFALAAVAAGLVYCGMMAWGGWVQIDLFHMVEMESEDLKWPLWIPYSVLVIGFGLAVWRLLVTAWRVATFRETSLLGSESDDALKQFAEKEGKEDAAGRQGEAGS
ncbi:MAG: TRAP transporter small permease [Hyphomicrobiales bacterium]|nr:TRAP transporter small permease [Hyphomicrobiales bacterium]